MLKSLDLTNFRSYRQIKMQFDHDLVVILGPNAVGKTNLLESIYVAATTHSFRGRDREIIHYGEDFYRVVAGFDDVNQEVRFVVEGDHHRKNTLLDGGKRPHGTLMGLNPVVIFEPSDMNIFASYPDHRRRYLDVILSQVDRAYAAALATYRKIIRQRNSLIHQAKLGARLSALDDQLFIWNLQIVEPALKIIQTRDLFIKNVSPLLRQHYNQIAHKNNRTIDLKYLPSLLGDRDSYLQALKNSLAKDIAVGYTTHGPHRDDFTVEIDGRNLMQTASRGELRTVILALKLAEMDYCEDQLKKRPLLLLDDVFSELDAARRDFLLANVSRQQTIITATDLDKAKKHDYQLIDLSGVARVA